MTRPHELATTDPKRRTFCLLTTSLRLYPHQPHLCAFFEGVAETFDRRQRPSRYGHGFERRWPASSGEVQ